MAPKVELCEQHEEAKSCKMASATCAQNVEKPDVMAKLNDLFTKFWRKIASREQQATVHKPVKHIPTVLPPHSQHRRTLPQTNRAQKCCRRRQGSPWSCNPTQLTLRMAALHRNKHPVKSSLQA
ncbi:Hypothetical predicted protein, partial [Pelobates cultripes]